MAPTDETQDDPHGRIPAEWLDRYLMGEASAEEQAKVVAWMSAAAPGTSRRVRSLGEDVPSGELDAAADRVWRRVRSSGSWDVPMGKDAATPETPSRRTSMRRAVAPQSLLNHWRRQVGLAVALCGVVGAMLWGRAHRTSRPDMVRTYVSAPGRLTTVQLASGVQAILGPATTMSVVVGASDRQTTVSLVGQAYFTVHAKDRAPFTVRAGHAVARVLGTTFLVRRYATDHAARVIVADGKVSVRGVQNLARESTVTDSGAIMGTRTIGIVDDSGHVRVTPNITVEDYTDWTTGRLVFRQTPVQDIAAELSRAYGVDIRLTDSTLSRRALTWTISIPQLTLADVLDALTGVLNAHVTQSGKIITIVPGRPGAAKPAGARTPYILESQYGR